MSILIFVDKRTTKKAKKLPAPKTSPPESTTSRTTQATQKRQNSEMDDNDDIPEEPVTKKRKAQDKKELKSPVARPIAETNRRTRSNFTIV